MSNAVTLRPWAFADVENLVKYGNNWNIARHMTDRFPHPYTVEKAQAFIEFATKDDPSHLFFAIDMDGQAIGGIGIHPREDIHRMNAEIGYWLAESFWGRGIIVSAIRQVVPIAFETYAINRLFATVFGANSSSQKALEKAGFTLEARFEKTLVKDGELLDELVYALRR